MVAALFARNAPTQQQFSANNFDNVGMPSFAMSHDHGGNSNHGASAHKMRKPIFQPFYGKNIVVRGLQNGELIQVICHKAYPSYV